MHGSVDCSTGRGPRQAGPFWYSGGSVPAEASVVVDPELLEILACPECKTPVAPVHDGRGLKCEQCRRVYPIKDDIPVMLIDEATIDA
ncbi:MAG: Trm112 family protein [Acidobacteria bacterium]|nr:Trm112 family protein [Acidobacteriota bacterium]